MLRALLAAIRRFLSRRAARRLLALGLPRGLREEQLALPPPPREPPANELWTGPAIGRRASRLFRLSALPLPHRLAVLDARKFRLDPDTHAPANEGIVPLAPPEPGFRWVLPEFRRRFIDLPWMARDRVRFLGPTPAEWFLLWWEQAVEKCLGPGEPHDWERPDEVDWAMDDCKEQMLIRRDVAKDEEAPPAAELSAASLGHPLAAWVAAPLPELVPPKQWVEVADPRALLPAPQLERAPREAYLRWRTLLDSLGE